MHESIRINFKVISFTVTHGSNATRQNESMKNFTTLKLIGSKKTAELVSVEKTKITKMFGNKDYYINFGPHYTHVFSLFKRIKVSSISVIIRKGGRGGGGGGCGG